MGDRIKRTATELSPIQAGDKPAYAIGVNNCSQRRCSAKDDGIKSKGIGGAARRQRNESP